MAWDSPKYQVTPDCCDAMRFTRAIVLRCAIDYETGRTNEVPHWELRLGSSHGVLDDRNHIGGGAQDFYKQLFLYIQGTHLHCPFCSRPVPAIELKPDADLVRIQIVTDGGYYCDTCKKRLIACNCPPPWMCWRIVP